MLLTTYVLTAGFAAPSPPSCDLPAILQPGVTNEQIALPADPKDLPAWRDGLAQWRASCRAAIGYTGKIYEQPALNWTSTSYIQPQSHPYDRLFYDVSSHSYTMDVFLADLTQRYGGIDSVLVWPTYTNIGMDDRNQFDLIRAMPGGAPVRRRRRLLPPPPPSRARTAPHRRHADEQREVGISPTVCEENSRHPCTERAAAALSPIPSAVVTAPSDGPCCLAEGPGRPHAS